MSKEIALVNDKQNQMTRKRILGSSGEEKDLIWQYHRIEQIFYRIQVSQTKSYMKCS